MSKIIDIRRVVAYDGGNHKTMDKLQMLVQNDFTVEKPVWIDIPTVEVGKDIQWDDESLNENHL